MAFFFAGSRVRNHDSLGYTDLRCRKTDTGSLVHGLGHILNEFYLGISNVRGQILALFELGSFFEVKLSAGEQARIIVLGEERSEFGIRADAVFEVRRLRNDEILEGPQSVTPAARSILRGVTENALLVLNGAALLQDPRLIIAGDSAAGFLEVPS